jgi:hypothetical protein
MRTGFILLCLLLSGCTLFVAGAATGIGVYSYIDGELKRSYQSDFDKTVQVSAEVLETLDIKITEKISQGMTATIQGEYYNGKPVTIRILRADTRITEVGVRSGLVGVWDKEFSERIHENIAQKLQP